MSYESPDPGTWPRGPGKLTVNCVTGQCRWCLGFIDPLENDGSDSRPRKPCSHRCHTDGTGNAPDFKEARQRALAQHYR